MQRAFLTGMLFVFKVVQSLQGFETLEGIKQDIE